MPTYYWSGKSPAGEDVADYVEAESAEASKVILERRGWTGLELHGNDITQHVKAGIRKASSPERDPHLSPKEELEFVKGEYPGFWAQWWRSMVQVKGLIGVFAFLFAFNLYRQRTGWAIFFGAILAVIVLLFPLLYVWFVAPMKQFEKLHKARTWWRWDEVLYYLDELKKSQRRTKMGIGRGELARYWALALVGKGQVEQGIAIFNQEAAAAEMPDRMKYSHLATMYHVAQNFEKCLECRRAAVVASKEDGVACIDLATYLVDPMGMTEEAKEWLKKIETKSLPVITQPSIPYLRGLIAWREKDYQSANAHFSEALEGKQKHAKNKYFAFEAVILSLRGRLAIVNAALGNYDVARSYFDECSSYLAATKRDDLINEYEKFAAGAKS
jgi:tetratricopeptide (TPR) repeat protein